MPVIQQQQQTPVTGIESGLGAFTALDLIKSAMRVLNVLASGEEPSGAEAADGLGILNQMLDSWQIERLMIFTIQRVVNDINGNPFNLVSGQQVYKVGLGGDFNIPRPPRIARIGIISLNNTQQPLELPLE